MAGCLTEKLRQCLHEKICQRSTVSSAFNSPQYWILRYIRSYLFNIGRYVDIFYVGISDLYCFIYQYVKAVEQNHTLETII